MSCELNITGSKDNGEVYKVRKTCCVPSRSSVFFGRRAHWLTSIYGWLLNDVVGGNATKQTQTFELF